MRRLGTLLCLAASLGPGRPAMAAEPPAPATTPAPARELSSEARGRFLLALVSLKSGDADAAAREFGDPAWAATPLADYALLFRAEALLEAGDEGEARVAARRAADATPQFLPPSALLRVATVLSGAGDDAAAAAVLRRFLATHPGHYGAPRARLALGQALLADGRNTEALRAFQEVWILFPASSQAERAGQEIEALAGRGVTVPAPTRRERVERAERLLAGGLGDKARSEADALLAEGLPAELQGAALQVVFEASRRAGRYDTAQATVSRALSSLAPAARPAWLLDLARLHKPRNRDLAMATLDRLIREYPKSPEASEALLLKGRLLEEGDKAKEAEASYRKLVDAHPDGAEVAAGLWRLGWLSWFRRAYADASGAWSRLLAIRGGNAYRDATAYWLGRVDEMRGEPESASRRFARLERAAPRSYYGVLAGLRSSHHPSTSGGTSVTLPGDPLVTLRADVQFGRVEALRAVGLTSFADEEMSELTRRAAGDSKLLYALSVAYAQESRYHLALRILRRYFTSVARAGAATTPRMFWEVLYPIGWRSELTDAAGKAAVDPLLVAAVVREESSYHPQARSRAGARGLMQLMPDTARPMAKARRMGVSGDDFLDDPAANLELGSAYLGGLLRQFGDARLAVAAYNAGPTRVREWWGERRSDDLEVWVEQIPFNETRGFVKRVMLSWTEYRRVYGPTAPADGASSSQEGSGIP
jgi:soluble lytic murein transglycosylase